MKLSVSGKREKKIVRIPEPNNEIPTKGFIKKPGRVKSSSILSFGFRKRVFLIKDISLVESNDKLANVELERFVSLTSMEFYQLVPFFYECFLCLRLMTTTMMEE